MLSKLDQDIVAHAAQDVAAQSGVAFETLIVPISDSYFGYVLFDSLLLAGLIDIILYLCHLPLHWLLLVAALFILLVFVPFYRQLMVCMLPRRIRHHHAARSAVGAYHHLAHQVEASRPVVLLYVSLAERYVHVLHSRALRTRVPETAWQNIVNVFTVGMRASGLRTASLQAMEGIGKILGG